MLFQSHSSLPLSNFWCQRQPLQGREATISAVQCQLEVWEFMPLAQTINAEDQACKPGSSRGEHPHGEALPHTAVHSFFVEWPHWNAHWYSKMPNNPFPTHRFTAGGFTCPFLCVWKLHEWMELLPWDWFSWCHLREIDWLHLVSEHLPHCRIQAVPSPIWLFSCTTSVTLFTVYQT